MKPTRTPCAQAGIAVALAFAAGLASAGTVSVPGTKTPTDSIAACAAGAKAFKDCTVKAFVSADTATAATKFTPAAFNGTPPKDQTFKTAFDNWNATQKSGVTWTLVNGGALDVTLTVDPFTAKASAGVGGLSNFTVAVTFGKAYKGPTLDQLVWSQGLYTNDSPTTPVGSFIDPPAVTLDSYSFNKGGSGGGGAFKKAPEDLPKPPANSNNQTVNIGASPANTSFADPIYPFQFADKHFEDAPKLGWPSASFRAIALLSTVSETTDAAGKVTAGTLTVYDGVSYGFDLSAAAVPEPMTGGLMSAGLLVLAALRRRSVRAAR